MRSLRSSWLVLFVGAACAHAQSQPVALLPGGPLEVPTPPPESEPSPEPSPEPGPRAAMVPPGLRGPALTDELLELRARAQRHLLGAGNEIEDQKGQRAVTKAFPVGAELPYAIDGNELGNFVEIENEAALTAFHDALRALAAGEGPEKLRVLAYGASHTQGDFFTGYLRRYLQARFGNGGLGFMQFARVNNYYRSSDASVTSKGFRIEHVQRKDAPEHGRFGLLGAAAVSSSGGAFGTIERSTRAAEVSLGEELELFFMEEPKGGDFTLTVDGSRLLTVRTKSDELRPGYARAELPADWARITVRTTSRAPVRLFGGAFETRERGIVIDTLGINGTRASNLLAWDEALWHEHVARRDPRLILLAYGTNEAVDSKQPIEDYESNLEKVLAKVRAAAPNASCLLVGPGDFPKEVEGGYLPRPRLLEIVDVQRKLAFETGCGFFDTLEFMGGEGSMSRWSRAFPPMGAQDHIHLTARGYVRWGMVLGDALMLPLDGAPSSAEVPLTAAR